MATVDFPAGAKVLGAGAGGVEELQATLDDRAICWCLLRFQVGSGTFVRSKLVAVHFNGDVVPTVRRGRLNSQTASVLAGFGNAHLTVEVKRSKDLTLDFLCERMLNVFVADDGNYSVAALKEQYETRQAETMLRQTTPALPAVYTANERQNAYGLVTAEEALQAVGSVSGRWNWVILEPTKIALSNAGFGGLEEMKGWLKDEMVAFGVIRFSFDQAAMPTLVKHVFFHWVGPSTPAVRRGQWNSNRGLAEQTVRKFCAITCSVEAHSLKALELENMIVDLRNAPSVGNGNAVSTTAISAKEYVQSLEQERARIMQEEHGTVLDAASIPLLPGLKAAVVAVRGSEDPLNWVCVGIEEGARQASPQPSSGPQRGKASWPDVTNLQTVAQDLTSPYAKTSSSISARATAAAAEVARPTAAPVCQPCSNFKLDTKAEQFGICVCGHPQGAHKAKSDNPAAAARARLDTVGEPAVATAGEPCSNFKADTKAAQFGMCICGYPQGAHKMKAENPAAAARARFDVAAEPAAVAACEPCSNFKLNTKAEQFGMCFCGFPQGAHKLKHENPAAAARAQLAVATDAVVFAAAGVPCSNFVADTKAAQFGVCICGHPQVNHKVKNINPAERALADMKGKKNAIKEAGKTNRDEARAAVDAITKENARTPTETNCCAGCSVQ